MVKAIRVHLVGGHHHLQYEDIELPRPGCDEVEVRHTAIGVNDPDVDACKGWSHHSPHSSFTPGLSAVGVITELGTGVIDHHIGQRVGYVNATKMGAFSETSIVPVNILIPLPSHLSNEQAAAILFQGLTTWMLLKKVYPVRRGDLILVHNAASGLGAIISQWARSLRAFVIGTVGDKEEIEHAKNNGCSGVVVDGGSGFVDGVRELTDGEGIAVSFYSAGKRSLTESLECLAPKGMLVSVGATRGETSVDFKDLAGRGSLFLACPVLGDYIDRREDLLEGAQHLFDLHKSGAIQVQIGKKYPLVDVSQALDAMVAGEVQGSCILIPPIPNPAKTPHGS